MTSLLEHLSGAAIADTPEGLSAIHQRGCAAVIWRREPLQEFQDWIDGLEPALLPRTRIVLQPGDVRDAVRHVCDLAGVPDCPERVLLVDDIAALAHAFAEIACVAFLRVRLEVVDSNACREFHFAPVSSRLICTYRGTGTQYGVSTDGAAPKRVFTTPTGAPILLRGTLWPETPPSSLLHRSPLIPETSETRFLLVLDPLAPATDETDHLVH